MIWDLKDFSHTELLKNPNKPYQRGRSAQLSEQHTYHWSPELFTMPEKPETSTSAAEDTVTFSEQHYKPINTLQDFRDLILKAPYGFEKAEMLPQLSPCDTKLSSQLSAASSLQLEKHQADSQIQLLQTQDCNSTHSLFKVYIKAEPETTQETEAG